MTGLELRIFHECRQDATTVPSRPQSPPSIRNSRFAKSKFCRNDPSETDLCKVFFQKREIVYITLKSGQTLGN